jgi:hypothetical protein
VFQRTISSSFLPFCLSALHSAWLIGGAR